MEETGLAGLASLGVTFGFGVESTVGVKPSSFKQLTRINSIGGISITPETIDASALEDYVERSIAGRGSTGGSWSVTVNTTPETLAEWKKVIADYKTAKASGVRMWFEIIIPGISDAFFVVAQPPEALPLSELGQNTLLTTEFSLTLDEYKGLDTVVAFTE